MKLWDSSYEQAARKHFNWWYRWATHSRLKPMIDKAKMLVTHLPNILTYRLACVPPTAARRPTCPFRGRRRFCGGRFRAAAQRLLVIIILS